MDELWSKIQELQQDFIEGLSLVKEELLRSIPSDQPRVLYNASRHLISTGGKHIRPALAILSFRAADTDGDLSKILSIATATELIHTATIIHDDIIDKSIKRRGAKTVNTRWGNDAALIAGDLLFSKAFGMIGSHENRELSEIISNACMKLAEGEVLEMLHTGDTDMTEEVYMEVIERKTAALFEACTKCGAILGGASNSDIEALARYGYHLGTGFQMIDDILDVIAGEFKLGKPIGLDITLGKPTLIVLHALKVTENGERETLEKIMRGKVTSDSDAKMALEIVKNTNSIDYASERARSLIHRAKLDIKGLKDSNAKKALELVADYTIDRDF
ncbi:MAG: polyprenyl synthetase family protein [Candidatus Hydrothermarchaeales archaeon]